MLHGLLELVTFTETNYYDKDNNNYVNELKRKYKKKKTKPFVLDKKEIPADKNAYVHRNPNNDNKWYLYFYDRVADKRYRMVLTDPATGKHPPNTLKGQDEAWML